MTLPLGVDGIVELAEVERSGFVESIHLGAAVAIGPDGSTLVEHGDSSALIYPRSTLKLVQAVGMLRAGLDLSGERLALAAASHIGTPEHVRVVREILAVAGLGEEALQCPADWPADSASRTSAERRATVTMGCSGKHAAMLLTCVRNGWPIESYLEPEHPLQQLMRQSAEEFACEPVSHVGVDGCGTPVFAISLRGLATAIGRVGSGDDAQSAAVVAAIRSHAWALDTPAIARVIDELGVIAKSGAEGVFVASATDGTAVAVKIIDGSSRALIPVGVSLLAGVGAVELEAAEQVVSDTTEPVLGAGRAVGAVRSRV
ncbi:asparaginase [soil metagenome]